MGVRRTSPVGPRLKATEPTTSPTIAVLPPLPQRATARRPGVSSPRAHHGGPRCASTPLRSSQLLTARGPQSANLCCLREVIQAAMGHITQRQTSPAKQAIAQRAGSRRPAAPSPGRAHFTARNLRRAHQAALTLPPRLDDLADDGGQLLPSWHEPWDSLRDRVHYIFTCFYVGFLLLATLTLICVTLSSNSFIY